MKSPISRHTQVRGIALVGALLALQACTESAEVRFTFTSTLEPTRSVVIDNFQGSVNLHKGQAGSAVTGSVRVIASGFDSKSEARAAAEDVAVTESGTALDLELVVVVPGVRGSRDFDIDLDLTVPDGVAVTVTTDNGRVSVDSLPVVLLETTNGPITTRFTEGGVAGTELRATNGAISVESHQGDIDARTTNAAIELIAIAGSAEARTTNGAVVARVSPPTGGEVNIATTNAPVDLTIARDFGASLLAVTTAPGVVFIEGLIVSLRPTPPSEAEGTIGNGAGIIDVRTTNADIVIRGR